MKFVEGSVVRSAAGHDRGDFQLVISVEGEFAWVCDGKHRPLEKLKKKKRKHLFLTNTVLDISSLNSNRAIFKALSLFRDSVH
ncbi:MAG: hypothetical protein LBP36_02125 [Oscillospiraceae bacterium]|jgi:ribosomal protein L14E/L6E/L27E|nr:hypothetical protein [Oscillospiraceae bacterium]